MKFALKTLPLLAVLCAMPAMAATEQTGFYIGAGYSNVDLDIKYVDENLSAAGFTLYGGYNFRPSFGLEASVTAATGLGGNDIDLTTASFSVGPKFNFVITDNITLFAKLALASVALEDDYNDDDWDWDDNSDYSGIGYSFGAGAHFAVTEHLNLRLAYEQVNADLDADSDYYNDDLDAELSLISLSLHYQF